ncbi:hypothetical protein [Amycolatopsis pigmentata]|uniref:Uncharacterized protein n=1 Tax=Amycolatopsis pigmentata TaxID=450801 RepID=A0ABW5FKU0_9PSEU
MPDDQTRTGSAPRIMSTRAPAMAWTTQDVNTDRIYWSPGTSAPGGEPHWGEPSALLADDPAFSTTTPSLCGNQSPELMAWKGSGDNNIWYSQWDSAKNTWGPQIKRFKDQTQNFPTLVRYRDRTFMFWQNSLDTGQESERDSIFWAEFANGAWFHPGRPDLQIWENLDFTTDGVAAAWNTHTDSLYIVYRGYDGRLWLREFDDGAGWDENGPRPIGGAKTSAPPALACDGNVMFAAWRNIDDEHISWAWSVSGGTGAWFGPYTLTDRLTSSAPALAAVSTGDVVMVWKGGGNDPRVWWSRLRNNEWGPQQAFPDRWVHADRRISLWAPTLG